MTIRTVASSLAGTDRRSRRAAIDAPHRTRNGPRRSEAARVAVLRAADDLLVDSGFQAVTVGSIAERAGVSKQTIYRWWRSKIDILLDVLEEDLPDDVTSRPPGTESAQDVLTGHVTHLNRVFTRSDTGRVLFVLIGHALQDAATASALRNQVLDRRRDHARARLRKALSCDAPGALPRQEANRLLDLLAGPVFHRAFMTGRPTDPLFAERLAATVLTCRQGTPPDGAPAAGPTC
ncbi:TetR/AcrR family transcriptional regulator [Streptomyces sp. R11]|uniref:TetR/AcrR family transcriptional regulator n=1 Tax=Streptomyces sp. R11 TaxID=3238625 RepID=A0AB39N8C5_9ACTN